MDTAQANRGTSQRQLSEAPSATEEPNLLQPAWLRPESRDAVTTDLQSRKTACFHFFSQLCNGSARYSWAPKSCASSVCLPFFTAPAEAQSLPSRSSDCRPHTDPDHRDPQAASSQVLPFHKAHGLVGPGADPQGLPGQSGQQKRAGPCLEAVEKAGTDSLVSSSHLHLTETLA